MTRHELDHFDVFPGLASRFYHSLAVVLSRRLRDITQQLTRGTNLRKT